MATHFICQPTEPLAHRYPLVLGPEKGHGAVSEYEVLNLGNKAYTQFPPVGWDNSQTSEESIPLCYAPAPSWKGVTEPDPELCITPEKSSNKPNSGQKRDVCPKPAHQVHLITPDPELCITPEKDIVNKSKRKHHVKFDVEDKENTEELPPSMLNTSGSGRTYKPDAYAGDDKWNIDNTQQNKSKTYALKHVDGKSVYVAVNKDYKETNQVASDRTSKTLPFVSPSENLNEENEGKTIRIDSVISTQKKQKHFVENQLPVKETIPNIPKNSHSGPARRVRVTRETKEGPIPADYKFPFNDNNFGSVLESEHVFNRPEYNSTMRMRRELESIKDSTVNVTKALERKLNKSETKKAQIREKAASKVTLAEEESKFSGLVSLSIPVESVCTQVEEKKSAKAKPTKHHKTQVAKGGKEPDLMEFFTADLQPEFAELSLPGLSRPTESLSAASQQTAFDLYRHNRVWNCTSNFKEGK